MLRILLVIAALFVFPLIRCFGQYEGQVIVTYDGPSYGAPMQGGYTGGSSGGQYTGGSSGGQMMMYQRPVMMASGGSTGGSGGYGYYQQSQVQYVQAQPQVVQYYQYQQPRRFFGGNGLGFNANVGFGFGGGCANGNCGGGRMVCGPYGCSMQ